MDIQALIDESALLESKASQIQQGETIGISETEINTVVEQYERWYAQCLAALPDSYVGRFTREYEGTILSHGIKNFLDSPTERNPLHNSETASLMPFWLYPFPSAFRSRLRAQRQILREVLARQVTEATRQAQESYQLKREIVEGFLFIAMPMAADDPTLDDVHDTIKEVSVSLGLDAERVDDPQTNERITSRILESLAKAEYVVADLTHNKPNVYWEAGYAHALGKTPVYIARAGTRIEFDLKDYPILFFNNMRELKSLLEARLGGLSRSRQQG